MQEELSRGCPIYSNFVWPAASEQTSITARGEGLCTGAEMDDLRSTEVGAVASDSSPLHARCANISRRAQGAGRLVCAAAASILQVASDLCHGMRDTIVQSRDGVFSGFKIFRYLKQMVGEESFPGFVIFRYGTVSNEIREVESHRSRRGVPVQQGNLWIIAATELSLLGDMSQMASGPY